MHRSSMTNCYSDDKYVVVHIFFIVSTLYTMAILQHKKNLNWTT